MYQENTWTIPEENTEGYIKDFSGKVLGLPDYVTVPGSQVTIEMKMVNSYQGQKWYRSKADPSGYFTLQNPISERFLTAGTRSSLTIEGIKCFLLL